MTLLVEFPITRVELKTEFGNFLTISEVRFPRERNKMYWIKTLKNTSFQKGQSIENKA